MFFHRHTSVHTSVPLSLPHSVSPHYLPPNQYIKTSQFYIIALLANKNYVKGLIAKEHDQQYKTEWKSIFATTKT